MNTQEKLHLVINVIAKSRSKKVLSPFVALNLSDFPRNKLTIYDIKTSLNYLEKDEPVLFLYKQAVPKESRNDRFVAPPSKQESEKHLLRVPTKEESEEKYTKGELRPPLEDYDFVIKLLPEFDNWYATYQGKHIIYEVTMSFNNQIFINSSPLSKPNLYSSNTEVMVYLLKNPNRNVAMKEILSACPEVESKDFNKILEQLRFTGDLRKTFFKVNKATIFFKNKITKNEFDSLHIPALKLPSGDLIKQLH